MYKSLIVLVVFSVVCPTDAQITIRPVGDGDWTVTKDENMYATPPGLVGIGTTDPWEKLHVVGDALFEAAVPVFTPILASSPGSPLSIVPFPVWVTLSSQLGADAGIRLTSVAGSFEPIVGANTWNIFREGESTDLIIQETFPYPPGVIDAMTFKAGSGDIGIGTPEPEERVHVVGNVKIENDPSASSVGYNVPLTVINEGSGSQLAATFRNPADISSKVRILMGVGGSGPTPLIWDWLLTAASGSFSIGSSNVFPPTLNLSSSGYLGVAVAQPNYGVHLPNITSNSGKGLARQWLTYSSQRWKTKVQTIEQPMDKVRQLRGVTFEWKEQDERDMGLIAEEVVKVIPEVVHMDENGEDANGVAYERLVALLIEAVKEQDRKIQELEERLAEKETLASRIEALERMVTPQARPIGFIR